MKAVFNFGAGVDGVLALPGLPRDVPLVRLEDAGMAAQMAEYVLRDGAAHRGPLRRLRRAAARAALAAARSAPAVSRFGIGVLGLGVIGGAIAQALSALGFRVRGQARTPRTLDGVDCYAGDAGFDAFLDAASTCWSRWCRSTPATRGLLNRRTLARLADGAHLVNIGRGALVDRRRPDRAARRGQARAARRSTCSIPSRCRPGIRSGRIRRSR